MTPTERTMPVIEVSGRSGRWIVHLPGGDSKATTLRGVKALVDREACGSAIRYRQRATDQVTSKLTTD